MGGKKIRRIRDPLHGLVEFDTQRVSSDALVWDLLNTQPLQRLRRVKQLGFTESVYPGATHSRFSHSIGTFHVARKLAYRVCQLSDEAKGSHRETVLLAAAALHDVGHGPFSHAFESVCKDAFGTKAVLHETWSSQIIRSSEVKSVFDSHRVGLAFADEVADMVRGEGLKDLYQAVVSSQFDADRLDYMQRDRLMTGTGHGGIDADWLISNLVVADVPYGVDDEVVTSERAIVLDKKAVGAGESYVLALFQLYETVYLHKTTRGIEVLFRALLSRLFKRVANGGMSALPSNHPLVRFAQNPSDLERYLSIDDSSVLGALPLLIDGDDPVIGRLADRLLNRKVLKCYDLTDKVHSTLRGQRGVWSDDEKLEQATKQVVAKVKSRVEEMVKEELLDEDDRMPLLLLDNAQRDSYNSDPSKKGPLNLIRVAEGPNSTHELSTCSVLLRKARPVMDTWRVYYLECDGDEGKKVAKVVTKLKTLLIEECKNVDNPIKSATA